MDEQLHRAASEQDMIVRSLPLREALEEALGGGITHAGSIAALTRAARYLGLAIKG